MTNGDVQVNGLLNAALQYGAGRLSIIPIGNDKRPAAAVLPRDPQTSRATWKPFQEKIADDETIRCWFSSKSVTGVAAICGKISGGLLIIDFDEREFYGKWLQAVGDKADGLPVQQTGRGFQVALRCDDPGRNTELSWIPDEGEKSGRRVAIETRGEGGYAVLPPSLHPSGKIYEVVSGDFAAVPHVDMDRARFLLDSARQLDQAPLTKQQLERAQKAKLKTHKNENGANLDIIGKFNKTMPLKDMLQRAGYTSSGDRFIRPGGGSPSVVVFEDPPRSYHHSSGDALHGPHAHDSFSIFAETEHDGDVKAAVKAAAKELGIELHQRQPQASDYHANENGIIWMKPTNDGEVEVPLTNFRAQIVADVIEDDGAEVKHTFEIEARIHRRQVNFTIPASKFAGLHWAAENLGAAATVHPGFAVKDRARFAIQELSGDPPRRTVYTHTGWRKVGDDWVYLHAGGAIGPVGTVRDIGVELRGSLSNYELCDPPAGEDLARAIAAVLKLLELGPDRVTAPVFCAVWRAAIQSCDFSLHLSGDTGVFKTEVAALAQQFFGPAMDARHLPGSWSSTGNSLEAQAFVAKDALFVVDDFAPTGSTYDVQRTHREADRVLRAQGNRSGRGRMRADGSLRADKPPRGLIVSTGEDVPRGKSLRSRMMIVEVEVGDISIERLTSCQSDAAAGLYAAAMAAYLMWAAAHYDDIVNELPGLRQKLRDLALADNQHRRTPGLVADLAIGAELFLKFAESVGEITATQRHEIFGQCWMGLGQVAAAQDAHQGASDPAVRFIELLRSAIVAGNAHLVSKDGDAPEAPEKWGWAVPHDEDGQANRPWRPKGGQVGWVVDDDLYLDPDAAFSAAQRMAQGTGDGIPVTGPTLRRRLRDRGLLASVAPQRQRLVVRKMLQGGRREVLHLKTTALISTEDRPNRPNQPNEEDERPSEAAKGDFVPDKWAGEGRDDPKPAQQTVPIPDDGTAGPAPHSANGTVAWDGYGSENTEPAHEKGDSDAASAGSGTVGTVGTVTTTHKGLSLFDVIHVEFGEGDPAQPIATDNSESPANDADADMFGDSPPPSRPQPAASKAPLTEAEL